MKKIIAISVMFALIAGAAFADVTFGGGLGWHLELLKSDNAKIWAPDGSGGYLMDPVADYSETLASALAGRPYAESDATQTAIGTSKPIYSAIAFNGASLDASFEGDNYGGKVRLHPMGNTPWWSFESNYNPYAFLWWKPIDMFQITVGLNDGSYGTDHITGWGFNASAQDYVAVDNDSGDASTTWVTKDTTFGKPESRDRVWKTARGTGFYGGYGNEAAWLSFYPMDMLTVNLVLPFSSGHNDATKEFIDVIKASHIQFVIKTGDLGDAYLTFEGGGGNKSTDNITVVYDATGIPSLVTKTTTTYASTGTIWASYNITGIENLGLDVGVGYGLSYDEITGSGTLMVTTTKVDPNLVFGLGVTYAVSDDFGIKLRLGGQMMGKATSTNIYSTIKTEAPTKIGVQILPYYNAGALKVYFNAGFGMQTPTKITKTYTLPSYSPYVGGINASYNDGLSYTDWYVNPYVEVPAGGVTFWAGIKVLGDTKLSYSRGTDAFNRNDGVTKQNGSTMEWKVPIGISVGF